MCTWQIFQRLTFLRKGEPPTHAGRQTDRWTERQIHPLSHTGWRRLIGSPKLQVIFRKRATNYRALLWKVTYEDKGYYESSPLSHTPQKTFLRNIFLWQKCHFWRARRHERHLWLCRQHADGQKKRLLSDWSQTDPTDRQGRQADK